MEPFIAYFSAMPSAHRALLLAGGILFFYLLEGAVPLVRFNTMSPGYNRTRHLGLNLFFTLTTVLVNFLLAFVLVTASDWAVANNIGLLPWLATVSVPLWAQAIIGLLLLDLVGAWLVHYTEHQVWWLWQFHLIHHADTYLDTTTANRHHPGESIVRLLFTTLAVLLTGAPMWLVFVYQSLSALLSQFNHANIELPRRANRLLGLLLVTPNMHHVHHHHVLPLSNTNYGNIFPYWDRLFGTYAEVAGSELVYGIDTHPDPREHDHVGGLLKVPFQPYRKPIGNNSPETR